MENKLTKFLSSETFIKRLLSTVIIIPVMIIPVAIGGLNLMFIYLILSTFVVGEIILIIKNTYHKIYASIYLLMAIFSIIFFIILLISTDSKQLFISIIITIWIFDTFSYLGGSIFKGKKIFPKISKGKTYSGLFTGLIGTVILYFLFASYFNSIQTIPYYSILTISILAFIGDTVVSLLKRSAFIKDSGNLIPGHGGFLDRLDSFIFVFFVVDIYFLFI